MSLISLSFLLFLLILLIVYFCVPSKLQWVVLLIGSFVFYLFSGWKLITYLLVTIVSQFLLARKIDDCNRKYDDILEHLESGQNKADIKLQCKKEKKKYLLASLFINIGLLCFVKYTNFLLENITALLAFLQGRTNDFQALDILIPLGISFYTFQSTGYVIDVYRGKEHAENNLFRFALFVSFFPTIVQGPIERHSDLAWQLYEPHTFDYKRLCFGLQRMLWGYIKKLVVADRILVLTSYVFANYRSQGYGSFIMFGTVFLNTIRVYADFSGGMDIVIGFSEIIGIRLTENFNRPYFATSISDFWKRWHITLGAWFKRYVFYTISLSKRFNGIVKSMRKRFGNSARYIPASLASLVVFWIIGIWHGANWKYIAYGLYSAFFVSTGSLLQDVYASMKKKLGIREESKAWILFQIIRTMFFVTIGRYFSCAKDLPDALNMLKVTFTRFDPWVLFNGTLYTLGLDKKDFNFMLFSILLLFIVDFINERGIIIRERISMQRLPIRWIIYYAGFAFLLIFGMYGLGYDAKDFVYMHF